MKDLTKHPTTFLFDAETNEIVGIDFDPQEIHFTRNKKKDVMEAIAKLVPVGTGSVKGTEKGDDVETNHEVHTGGERKPLSNANTAANTGLLQARQQHFTGRDHRGLYKGWHSLKSVDEEHWEFTTTKRYHDDEEPQFMSVEEGSYRSLKADVDELTTKHDVEDDPWNRDVYGKTAKANKDAGKKKPEKFARKDAKETCRVRKKDGAPKGCKTEEAVEAGRGHAEFGSYTQAEPPEAGKIEEKAGESKVKHIRFNAKQKLTVSLNTVGHTDGGGEKQEDKCGAEAAASEAPVFLEGMLRYNTEPLQNQYYTKDSAEGIAHHLAGQLSGEKHSPRAFHEATMLIQSHPNRTVPIFIHYLKGLSKKPMQRLAAMIGASKHTVARKALVEIAETKEHEEELRHQALFGIAAASAQRTRHHPDVLRRVWQIAKNKREKPVKGRRSRGVSADQTASIALQSVGAMMFAYGDGDSPQVDGYLDQIHDGIHACLEVDDKTCSVDHLLAAGNAAFERSMEHIAHGLMHQEVEIRLVAAQQLHHHRTPNEIVDGLLMVKAMGHNEGSKAVKEASAHALAARGHQLGEDNTLLALMATKHGKHDSDHAKLVTLLQGKHGADKVQTMLLQMEDEAHMKNVFARLQAKLKKMADEWKAGLATLAMMLLKAIQSGAMRWWTKIGYMGKPQCGDALESASMYCSASQRYQELRPLLPHSAVDKMCMTQRGNKAWVVPDLDNQAATAPHQKCATCNARENAGGENSQLLRMTAKGTCVDHDLKSNVVSNSNKPKNIFTLGWRPDMGSEELVLTTEDAISKSTAKTTSKTTGIGRLTTRQAKQVSNLVKGLPAACRNGKAKCPENRGQAISKDQAGVPGDQFCSYRCLFTTYTPGKESDGVDAFSAQSRDRTRTKVDDFFCAKPWKNRGQCWGNDEIIYSDKNRERFCTVPCNQLGVTGAARSYTENPAGKILPLDRNRKGRNPVTSQFNAQLRHAGNRAETARRLAADGVKSAADAKRLLRQQAAVPLALTSWKACKNTPPSVMELAKLGEPFPYTNEKNCIDKYCDGWKDAREQVCSIGMTVLPWCPILPDGKPHKKKPHCPKGYTMPIGPQGGDFAAQLFAKVTVSMIGLPMPHIKFLGTQAKKLVSGMIRRVSEEEALTQVEAHPDEESQPLEEKLHDDKLQRTPENVLVQEKAEAEANAAAEANLQANLEAKAKSPFNNPLMEFPSKLWGSPIKLQIKGGGGLRAKAFKSTFDIIEAGLGLEFVMHPRPGPIVFAYITLAGIFTFKKEYTSTAEEEDGRRRRRRRRRKLREEFGLEDEELSQESAKTTEKENAKIHAKEMRQKAGIQGGICLTGEISGELGMVKEFFRMTMYYFILSISIYASGGVGVRPGIEGEICPMNFAKSSLGIFVTPFGEALMGAEGGIVLAGFGMELILVSLQLKNLATSKPIGKSIGLTSKLVLEAFGGNFNVWYKYPCGPWWCAGLCVWCKKIKVIYEFRGAGVTLDFLKPYKRPAADSAIGPLKRMHYCKAKNGGKCKIYGFCQNQQKTPSSGEWDDSDSGAADSGKTPAACKARAEWWWRQCGNSAAQWVTSVHFDSNKHSKYPACLLEGVCARDASRGNTKTWNDSSYGYSSGAGTSESRCLARAHEWWVHCRNSHTQIVTAKYQASHMTKRFPSVCKLQGFCRRLKKKYADWMDSPYGYRSGSGAREATCHGRAKDWYSWCGNRPYEWVKATYANTKKARTYPGCQIAGYCRSWGYTRGKYTTVWLDGDPRFERRDWGRNSCQRGRVIDSEAGCRAAARATSGNLTLTLTLAPTLTLIGHQAGLSDRPDLGGATQRGVCHTGMATYTSTATQLVMCVVTCRRFVSMSRTAPPAPRLTNGLATLGLRLGGRSAVMRHGVSGFVQNSTTRTFPAKRPSAACTTPVNVSSQGPAGKTVPRTNDGTTPKPGTGDPQVPEDAARASMRPHATLVQLHGASTVGTISPRATP